MNSIVVVETWAQVLLVAPGGRGQGTPFPRTVYAAADAVEIPAGSAQFEIHPESLLFREPDQPMPAAVTHIEARARRDPVDIRVRLAVLEITEGQFPVGTSQPIAEVDPERRAAERHGLHQVSSTVIARPRRSYFRCPLLVISAHSPLRGAATGVPDSSKNGVRL